MRPTNKRIALLSILAVILGVSNAVDAAPPRFVALGDLSGGDTYSVARDVSADGSKVVGLSKSGALPAGEAFVWTAGTGMTGLGSLSSFAPFSDASAISADGAWIVGTTRSPSSALEAFRYSDSIGGMDGIGFLPGLNFSRAYDVTVTGADEVVIVGFSRLVFKEAFRWTEAGGMGGLGYAAQYNNSRAFGVSADGEKISGFLGEIFAPEMEAFRWTKNSNTVAPLGFGMGGNTSDATSISASGTIIAGNAMFGADLQGFRWTNPNLVSIGALPGETESEALAISRDGKVIVGTSNGRAFIWDVDRAAQDPATAMVDVKAALEAFGIDLTGWSLLEATSVTDDGETVVGTAIDPDGYTKAFLATIPSAVSFARSQLIATGKDFSCALLAGGFLSCWGNFNADPAHGQTFTHLTAGETHICATQTDGGTFCDGTDASGSGKLVPPGAALGDISAGGEFTCGLALDGSILCSGELLGIPPPAGKFIDIASGYQHVCALRDDGELRCFGEDTFATGKLIPPDAGPFTQVTAGDEHTCALRDNAIAACFGRGFPGDPDGQNQASPPGGTFSVLAAGSLHTCGLSVPASGGAGAALVCFGAGANGSDFQSSPPVGDYTAVDAGGMNTLTGHSCAIATDGTIACWGQDGLGQSCPAGDIDCDGIPDAADNCPDDFNPDQIDFEKDGIGDECDLCTGDGAKFFDSGGDARNQADEDFDGRGDLCDDCLGNPAPTCDPVLVQLVNASPPPAPPPLGGLGASSAMSTGTVIIDFDLLIDCGSTPQIDKIALAIALPSGITATGINFGNDCTFVGCPLVDPPVLPDLPFGRLGDQVDPDNVDTFVLKPGDPVPPEANPNFLYFSLRAESASAGLCTQGQSDIFLARLTVSDLTLGFTPPFSTQGTAETVGEIAESDSGPVEDADIELQSGDPAATQITLEIVPDIVDNPDGTRFAIYATSPVDLWKVNFALQGDGDLKILGCADFQTDVCTPELPRFDCIEDGTLNSALFGPTLDFNSPDTYVLGPAAPGADLSGLPDVAANTMFVSFEAAVNVGFGSARSFNPGLGTTKLATVEFTPTSSQQGMVAPALVFAGVDTLFQQDRANSCSLISPYNPFQVTDFIREVNFGVAQASSRQIFSFGLDPDGDNFASDYDVCPFFPDNQSDTGGYESAVNPGGASANGIGNACECGEVFRDDGRAKIEDTDVIQGFLVEDVPPGTSFERCSTAGGPDCGPEDWVATWQVHTGAALGVEASCPPALP